jgi:hypothetical protein
MITTEQRAKLTQTGKLKIEPGKKNRLVLTDWKYKEESFSDKDTGITRIDSVLSFNVESVDDIKSIVPIEWKTGSKAACTILLDLIDKAEAEKRDFIAIEVFRIDKLHYNITDLTSMINAYRRV